MTSGVMAEACVVGMGMLYFRIFAGRVEQAFVPASEDSKNFGTACGPPFDFCNLNQSRSILSGVSKIGPGSKQPGPTERTENLLSSLVLCRSIYGRASL